MANDISTRLTVGGKAEEVRAFFAAVKSPTEKNIYLDFDVIIPRPNDIEVMRDWKGIRPAWYGWCVEHWGTKWPAYEQKKKGFGVLYFETAWQVARPIFNKLASQYPHLSFHVDYADEDLGHNAGSLFYEDGVLATETLLHGRHAVRMYFELTGHDLEAAGFHPGTFERLKQFDS